MTKGRLEAFSDGVIAIIITIMVLELRPPASGDLGALQSLVPTFGAYVMSFVYVGIYWNNHHHLFHVAQKVNGAVMWANLHLLFWLSLTPFASAWMGQHYRDPMPVAFYGVVLFCAAVAYYILARALVKLHGPGSALAKAVGDDRKGKISNTIYAVAIATSFLSTAVALALYALVAVIWLVPDKRIERAMAERG